MQAKAAGATVVSKPEIGVEKNGTREVLIRDPDVGAFVELFEKAQTVNGSAGRAPA